MGERSKMVVRQARMERLSKLSQQIQDNMLIAKPVTVPHNRKAVKDFYCIQTANMA